MWPAISVDRHNIVKPFLQGDVTILDALPSRPRSSSSERDSANRIIDAAERCFGRLGLNKTTMDDIALDAGVSRATVFRRFGNWDAVFREVLFRRAAAYGEGGVRLLTAQGPVLSRLENSLVFGVMEMSKDPWLRSMFEQAIGPRGEALFKAVFSERLGRAIAAAMPGMAASGVLRPSVNLEELYDWLSQKFVLLVQAGPWEENRLRRQIRLFVFPVIFRDRPEGLAPPQSSMEQRLEIVETRLVDLHQMLERLLLAADAAPDQAPTKSGINAKRDRKNK